MIITIFFIGFILGLAYSLIGEKLPLLVPDVVAKEDNSWILNLFIGVVNALIMLISYYYYGFSYEFFSSLIVTALVLIIFISDFKYMIILDSPLLIGLSILSGLLLFLLMLLFGIIGKKIFKREALGGGDIKLAILIGIILGFRLGLVSIILSSLIALPYALASLMLNKNKEVPFGPFLIGSMAIVFLFSDKFMNLINFLT